MTSGKPRSLDHLVLPVHDLDVAQTRLRALGFTVAPVGRHPFGTANSCVYLGDGTFLEPLAVADEMKVEQAIEQGNLFVSRDRAYRMLAGEEGCSALVLASVDAQADDEAFVAAGISAGPMLEFTRPFVDSTGKSDGATFRLAFAADSASPAPYFFTCQRVRSPRVDRSALQEHRNGVSRVGHIWLTADDPAAHLAFLSHFLATEPLSISRDTIHFALGKTALTVTSPKLLEDAFAIAASSGDGLRACAIQFECPGVAGLRRLLDADGIEYHVTSGSIVVPPAPGQGATFIFESRA